MNNEKNVFNKNRMNQDIATLAVYCFEFEGGIEQNVYVGCMQERFKGDIQKCVIVN